MRIHVHTVSNKYFTRKLYTGRLSISDSELTIMIEDRKFSVRNPVVTEASFRAFQVVGDLGSKSGTDHKPAKIVLECEDPRDLKDILWFIARDSTMDTRSKRYIAQKYIADAFSDS